MLKYFYLIILTLSSALNVFADDADRIYPNRLNTCKPTKALKDNYEPELFNTSNNLLHAAGLVPMYCGQRIVLSGKVLDKNCVPVSDAKVYLWQVGCDGKYPYKPLRAKVDHNIINMKPVSSFLGSGTATTDNEGRFQFVTIYPSKIGHAPPHINIRVEHIDLGQLQTKLYPRSQAEIEKYDFTIVMSETNLHRRY